MQRCCRKTKDSQWEKEFFRQLAKRSHIFKEHYKKSGHPESTNCDGGKQWEKKYLQDSALSDELRISFEVNCTYLGLKIGIS